VAPGRRLFPGSIRFRLTAWYALLLAAVLVTLGVSVLRFTEDRLHGDVKERVKRTAVDIGSQMQKNANDRTGGKGQYSFSEIVPNIGPFVSRGLKIQILNERDEIKESSEYASEFVLLAKPPPPSDTRITYGTTTIDDIEFLAVRLPVAGTQPDGSTTVIGAILVAEPLSALKDTLASLRRTLLYTSLAGLVLAVVGGWLLAGRALRPVSRVTATAAQIAAGDGSAASLGTRLRVPDTGDEIARLSATFNAMLDRLQAAFVAQQRFVADASHELRTPLTAIRGNVEVLARQMAARGVGDGVNGDVSAALGDMKRESARMGRLLDDLLLLARSDAPASETYQSRPVRLDLVARDAARSAAALVDGQRLEVVAPVEVTVPGDPDRLLQLLLILVENALRHTPAGAGVTVEVPPPTGGAARIVVRDEGEGIAPEHLPHLFDRFYRADGARGRATGGTGLGLAIARAIAQAHGGEIAVASAPGRGSAFTVTLPAGPRPRARLRLRPWANPRSIRR
jgi:signal transduction histidine kinase